MATTLASDRLTLATDWLTLSDPESRGSVRGGSSPVRRGTAASLPPRGCPARRTVATTFWVAEAPAAECPNARCTCWTGQDRGDVRPRPEAGYPRPPPTYGAWPRTMAPPPPGWSFLRQSPTLIGWRRHVTLSSATGRTTR